MPTPAPKSKAGGHSRDAHRRSRSRNTTPSASSLSAVDTIHSPYLQTSLNPPHVLSNSPVEDVFEGSGNSASPPSASTLRSITENVKTQLLSTIKPRGEVCERLMRELSGKIKERTERNRIREREMEQRAEEERRKNNTVTPKKRGREEDNTRPPAIGAHGVARQDGGANAAATSSSISSPVSQPPQSPAAKQEQNSDSEGEGEPHQPPPAPAIQQYQIFGDDPTEYPDDTVYEIIEVTPDMTDEERKEIYSVAHFPESDLHDLTAGTPPDRDFSNAKPPQQVNFTTFQNFAEPFIRPLTEEDRGFLVERGNRETPFVTPKLGLKHYKEIWAEEDGLPYIDRNAAQLPVNESRGRLEDIDDELAASDQISVGPAVARLLTAFRGEFTFRKKVEEEEVLLPGIDMEIDGENGAQTNGHTAEDKGQEPAATSFPDSNWKNANPMSRNDYASLEDRLQKELIYMGLISPTDVPQYNDTIDDDVSARLRYLQAELRRESVKNGARKRILEKLTEEWMSKQEYSTIADDLDNQINAAYLKRNRNIGKKGKQQKRPGGAGGGSHVVGVAQRAGSGGVGEPIKGLVERKGKWRNWIGPVVENGKTEVPKESVFSEEVMKQYEAREQEAWGEAEDA